MQSDLDDARRETDRLANDLRSAKSDLSAANVRLKISEENRARLEVEAQQMADELDVAKYAFLCSIDCGQTVANIIIFFACSVAVLRDKASKLSRAEATIEKYQRKLEEMTELRKQVHLMKRLRGEIMTRGCCIHAEQRVGGQIR
jgi:hypothetical protein